MNKAFSYVLIALALVLFVAAPISAQEQENKKLAQTGLQFLSVVSDAAAGAMGGAMTSLEFGSSSLFFNPAGMANLQGFFDVSISQNQWIADINHNSVAAAFRAGELGVFGLSLQTVDYGEIQGTVVAENDQGYLDTGNLDASALAIGVGYARALSDRFSVGGQVKWVRQSLAENLIPVTDSTYTSVENEVTPFAFDFGTQFKTGVKSLVFGMSVRNFSQEIEYEEEGFQLPLLFTLGISANVLDWVRPSDEKQSMIFSIDATHPRDHPEQLIFALEYKLQSLLFVRGGYVMNNDEDGPTFGFGVSKFGFQVDYGYTPFGAFDNVQRVTARFSK